MILSPYLYFIACNMDARVLITRPQESPASAALLRHSFRLKGVKGETHPLRASDRFWLALPELIPMTLMLRLCRRLRDV